MQTAELTPLQERCHWLAVAFRYAYGPVNPAHLVQQMTMVMDSADRRGKERRCLRDVPDVKAYSCRNSGMFGNAAIAAKPEK